MTTASPAVAAVLESTGMLPNTVELVATARAACATIVHGPISFAAGHGVISDRPYGILAGVVEQERAIASDCPMFSRPVTSTESASALTGRDQEESLAGACRAAY